MNRILEKRWLNGQYSKIMHVKVSSLLLTDMKANSTIIMRLEKAGKQPSMPCVHWGHSS